MTTLVVLLSLSFALNTAGADAPPPIGEGIGVDIPAPAPLTPVGNIFTTLPEFTFSENPAATNYKIKVYNTKTLELVYTFSGFNCEGGVCKLTPGTALKNANLSGKKGHYSWKVRAYVSGAWQPYSIKADFTVISTGFNSTFDVDSLKWKVVYGNWNLALSNYLKTKGTIGMYSSVVHKELTVNQLVYEVKMKRDSYEEDDNFIYFYGDVNPTDNYYDWNSYYSFDYSSDGFLSIWKRLDGSWTTIRDWEYSSYVNRGEWNTLTVWLDAPEIYFWINGNYVGYVTDTTFDSGFVGIGMWREHSIKSPLWVDTATTYYSDAAPYLYPAGMDGKVDPQTELKPSGMVVTDRQKAQH